MKRDRVSRRALLSEGCTIAGGLIAGAWGLSGCTPNGKGVAPTTTATERPEVQRRHPEMGYRRLGKTDLSVSEIILAGHLTDGQGRTLAANLAPDQIPAEVAQGRARLVAKCLDLGINYLDISSGVEAMAHRAALQGRRERMTIAADDIVYSMRQERCRDAAAQMRNIESCLTKLDTDYLDIWRPQFKKQGGHRDVEMEMCVEVFDKARRQGKVRFLGLATADREWIRHVMERFESFAVIYTPYTLRCERQPADLKSIDPNQLYEPSSWGGRRTDTGAQLFEMARTRDMAVVATDPFAGLPVGEDREQARLTLAYILSNPDLAAVSVEMASPSEVEDYARVVRECRGQA